jgi:hypothetical protein
VAPASSLMEDARVLWPRADIVNDGFPNSPHKIFWGQNLLLDALIMH